MEASREDMFNARKDLEAKIAARAWDDEDFRRSLLADPKAVLVEMLSEEFTPTLAATLLENITVTAHAETATEVHLVIPQNPANIELADEVLEEIAAGGWVRGAGCGCG